MNRLKINRFGPIEKADIEIGDMTIFVGPQASGKTLAAQLLLAFEDTLPIAREMRKFAMFIGGTNDFWDAYFTKEAREQYFSDNTHITYGEVNLENPKIDAKGYRKSHRTLYIPSERASLIFNGFPMPFQSLPPSIPFPVRFFSEFLASKLRDVSLNNEVFPKEYRFRQTLRNFLHSNLLMGTSFRIELNERTRTKEIRGIINDKNFHFDTLSAGLRESFPILFAIQELWRHHFDMFLIIEEPEINLHPNAIKTIMTLLMYIVRGKHKVVITTHSPYILELIQFFTLAAEKYKAERKKGKRPRSVSNCVAKFLGLHGIRNMKIADFLPINKTIKVHFFDRSDNSLTRVKDISNLSEDDKWGGLSSFTADVADSYQELSTL